MTDPATHKALEMFLADIAFPEWTREHFAGLVADLAAADVMVERLEAVLMDANVTYAVILDDGSCTPMFVERAALVKAMGYADESAWLARTAEINAQGRAAVPDPEEDAT